MKIIYNDQHMHQDCPQEMHYGQLTDSFENAQRMEKIYDLLKSQGRHDIEPARDHGDELIRKVHGPAYLDFLETVWRKWETAGQSAPLIPTTWSKGGLGGPHAGGTSNTIPALLGTYAFSADTAITAGTWHAAYMGAQAAISAQKAVSKGEKAAFALSRPPGHHAHANLYGGYCFINNGAVAAEGFLADGRKRVAILDIDFHHGNGAQDIFYSRSDVLTLSLHGTPEDCFPFYLGFENETGADVGKGFNRNFPMPLGTGFKEWRSTLKHACEFVCSMCVDALVVPLGVDTHKNDPISGFSLDADDYIEAGTIISDMGLPTVITMEGGYHLPSLADNVSNFLSGFDT